MHSVFYVAKYKWYTIHTELFVIDHFAYFGSTPIKHTIHVVFIAT